MQDTLTSLIKETLAVTEVVQQLSWLTILASLGTALVCGVIIYLIYRFFYRGTIYNDNFNTLLVMVSLITAFIIMTVSSNLALSLGMVGALSIVRFRAAIKDPLDVGFVFWAVASGLTAGAGLYLVALLATVFIAIVYILMGLVKSRQANYLVVIKYLPGVDESIMNVLESEKYAMKNKTQGKKLCEMTLEVRGEKNNLDEKLRVIKGVESVVKVEYNGDYLG